MVSPTVSSPGVPIYGSRLDLAVEEAGNYWKSGGGKIHPHPRIYSRRRHR